MGNTANKELGHAFFNSWDSLKKFLSRQEAIIIEIINIQYTPEGKYIVYYWCASDRQDAE